MKTIFSLKALAACWAGLLVALGAGAVALQLTTPPPAPPVVVALVVPAVEQPAPAPAPPVVAPMPFQNSSLVALLPPLTRPVPLPVPPIPPVRHVAHAGPRRAVAVYAARQLPAYDPAAWGQAMPYPGQYARYRPYSYAGPRTYYGW